MDTPFLDLNREALVAFYQNSRHFDGSHVSMQLGRTCQSKQDAIAAWLDHDDLKPNCYFDPRYYCEEHNIAHAQSLYHFLTHGWRIGNNPSSELDIHVFLYRRSISPFTKEMALDSLLGYPTIREQNQAVAVVRQDLAALRACDSDINRSLTIVTINLNNASGLQRTLESIGNQSDPCNDLIVVDGGSDDGSLKLLHKNQDAITTLLVGQDKGIFDAMNLAVRHAHSEYVLFMNSGDRFQNNECIEKVRPHLGYADIIYGDARFDDAEHAHPHRKKISQGMTFCHQSQYTRRCWLERFPFDTAYRTADWRAIVAAYLSGATFRYVNSILSVIEPDGFSKQHAEENFLERWSFSKKYFPLSGVDLDFRGELFRRFGDVIVEHEKELK